MISQSTSFFHRNVFKKILLLAVCILLFSCGGGGEKKSGLEVIAKAGADRIGASANKFDQVDIGDVIFLNSTGSVGTAWHWQVTGQSVPGRSRLTSNNTPVTGFYAEKAGRYTIQLTVSSGGFSQTDSLTVTLIDDLDRDGLSDDNDLDRDGDGFINTVDLFADERAKHADFDNDGIANYDTADTDNDGFADQQDDFPLDSNKNDYPSVSEIKEMGSSNQNDGISVSELVGNVPAIINAAINASDNRPDLDYFQMTFAEPGRYSAVLTGSSDEMRPSIAIIDALGSSVETTTANMPWSTGATAISAFIPSVGEYYLSVTDSSGKSHPQWTYSVKIFPDGDLDGVADDLEQAIESNHLTADSDGDGISDFVEIQAALADWLNYKDSDNDGLPLWWDLDSDGDGIPDSAEYYSASQWPDLSDSQRDSLNDVDNDNIANYLDIDSDNNSIVDTDEAGVNSTDPLDTDHDGIADFLDSDDDNDGLLDNNETSTQRLQSLDNASDIDQSKAMQIIALQNLTAGTEDIVRTGDQLVLTGVNLPDNVSDSWIMIRGVNDVLNLRADDAGETGISFKWPVGIGTGLLELYFAHDGKQSNAIQVQMVNSRTPVITHYTVDNTNNEIRIFGANLDNHLTINFTGQTRVVDNSGFATELSLGIPINAQTGMASVSSVDGESNAIWLTIKRQISGQIEMPPGAAINVSDLDVAWDVDEQIFAAENGTFSSNINISSASIITAVYEDPASTEEEPLLSAYLMALVLPEDNFVVVNSHSSVLALIWSAINPQALVAEDSLQTVRDILSDLDEVKSYGELLQNKLVDDSDTLNKSDAELQAAASQAILAAVNAIQTAIEEETVGELQSSLLKPRALEHKPAAINPQGMLDDIQIKERENTGNLDLINDTNMFLSAQMTSLSGTLVKPHTTAFWDLIAPQGYGVAAVSTVTPFNQPMGRSVIVQVVTPGADREFEPKIEAPYHVWQPLMARTVVQQAFWPAFQIAIGVKMDPKAITDIFLEHVFSVSEVSIKLRRGQTRDAMLQILSILKEDFLKQPPGSGPISKALVTYLAKKYGKRFLIKKLGRMLAIKLIPIFGQIETAVNVAGHIQNATGTVKAIVDLATTDAVLEYEVNFPPEIDEVISGAIRPSGKAHSFIITGRGFSLIKRELAPGVNLFAVPQVTFTDANGRSEQVYPDMGEVERHDDKMTVQLSGAFLDPDKLAGPIKIKVHHPEYTADAFVIKDPAIEVIDQIKITSVVPDKVHKGARATVYGAGFSNVISNNEVMIGGRSALISFATESMLQIVIPSGLEPGDYTVTARSMWNIEWSDWSNEFPIEIVEGQVKITVSDNGSDKDDAFALYVDGRYIDTMYASWDSYSQVYPLDLSAGPHTAMLLGVEAPDDVGTYMIKFEGEESLAGDSTSGSDLVPGVRKYYNFSVGDGVLQKPVIRLKAMPFHSRVPDDELYLNNE